MRSVRLFLRQNSRHPGEVAAGTYRKFLDHSRTASGEVSAKPIAQPAVTESTNQRIEAGLSADDHRVFLAAATEAIDGDCCRSLFVHADGFCACMRKRLKASTAANGADESLNDALREIAETLESDCCKSSLIDTEKINKQAHRLRS